MKRFRVVIEADFEFPDGAEIRKLIGETAIEFGGFIVKPALEFWQLETASEKATTWVELSEESMELVTASERRTIVNVNAQDESPN